MAFRKAKFNNSGIFELKALAIRCTSSTQLTSNLIGFGFYLAIIQRVRCEVSLKRDKVDGNHNKLFGFKLYTIINLPQIKSYSDSMSSFKLQLVVIQVNSFES